MSLVSTTTKRPSIAQQTEDDTFDDDAPREQVLVVEAAGQWLAIPATRVREVQRTAHVTRVPGAPGILNGIANVRGAVVTVLDLAVALAAPNAASSAPATFGASPNDAARRADNTGSVVLIEHGPQLIGLRVDSVRAVPLRDDAPLVPPAVAWRLLQTEIPHSLLAGVVRAEGEDIPMLDITALFARYLLSTKE